MVAKQLNFIEAIALFELYCRSKGLAPRTIETYLFSLNCLLNFLGQCDKSCYGPLSGYISFN